MSQLPLTDGQYQKQQQKQQYPTVDMMVDHTIISFSIPRFSLLASTRAQSMQSIAPHWYTYPLPPAMPDSLSGRLSTSVKYYLSKWHDKSSDKGNRKYYQQQHWATTLLRWALRFVLLLLLSKLNYHQAYEDNLTIWHLDRSGIRQVCAQRCIHIWPVT